MQEIHKKRTCLLQNLLIKPVAFEKWICKSIYLFFNYENKTTLSRLILSPHLIHLTMKVSHFLSFSKTLKL